jgi:hypothetical protein
MQPTVLSSCLFFVLAIVLSCKSSTAESSGEFKFFVTLYSENVLSLIFYIKVQVHVLCISLNKLV